ncbi:MAG: hypothetical protein ACRCUE_14725, partial [Bosea sp. (in: a-proteobacteria)]
SISIRMLRCLLAGQCMRVKAGRASTTTVALTRPTMPSTLGVQPASEFIIDDVLKDAPARKRWGIAALRATGIPCLRFIRRGTFTGGWR